MLKPRLRRGGASTTRAVLTPLLAVPLSEGQMDEAAHSLTRQIFPPPRGKESHQNQTLLSRSVRKILDTTRRQDAVAHGLALPTDQPPSEFWVPSPSSYPGAARSVGEEVTVPSACRVQLLTIFLTVLPQPELVQRQPHLPA